MTKTKIITPTPATVARCNPNTRTRRASPRLKLLLSAGSSLLRRVLGCSTAHCRPLRFARGFRAAPIMAEQLEQAVQAAQEAVTKQGDTVRSLKASLKEGKIEKAGCAQTQAANSQGCCSG